jgi:hypothetical protein
LCGIAAFRTREGPSYHPSIYRSAPTPRQKGSGYNKRSRVEATIGRYKQVIGDGLRSRKDRRRTTEVGVAVYVLNRLLKFGRPISARIA